MAKFLNASAGAIDLCNLDGPTMKPGEEGEISAELAKHPGVKRFIDSGALVTGKGAPAAKKEADADEAEG